MPEIYPVGGGKGGVGKSFIAASLGALLAKQGRKVVLLDLDLGASNLHTFLGIKNPKSGLDHYLSKKVTSLQNAAAPTDIPNLYTITSLYCTFEIANLFYAQKQKIITAIGKLPFDSILLDLGPGTNYNTLDFFLTSDTGILILTPDLPSIENSFRFIKAVYLRKLKQIIKQHAFNKAVKNASAKLNHSKSKTDDIIQFVLQNDPDKEDLLRDQLSQLRFKLILNLFRKNDDPELGNKIEAVCNRHFFSDFEFLGNIRCSDRMIRSVLSNNSFVLQHPDTPTSIDLTEIADKLNQKTAHTSRAPAVS
jgi:flagellar biosynthesis protein FlhG